MFKVGDIVKLKERFIHKSDLTLNKNYIVYETSKFNNNYFVVVINDDGFEYEYHSLIFELNVKEMRKQKIKKLCLKEDIK